MSAAAAMRILRHDTRRLTGVVLPALGMLGLNTRLFIVAAAPAGVPLAMWRARIAPFPRSK